MSAYYQGAGHEDGPDCAKHGLHYHLQGGGIKWPQPHACPSCGTWHVYRAQPAPDVAGLLRGAIVDGAIPAMRFAARRLDAIEGERKTAADLRADADKIEAIARSTEEDRT